MFCRLVLAFVVVISGASFVYSAPFLWIHDGNANLGTVDVGSGQVNLIGNMGVVMTDIAFDPAGNLFGVSFGFLYSINATTGNASLIGPHGIATGNALVFGADGTAYGAGASTTNLYTLDTSTGAGTSIGNIGFSSAGDLAFNNGNFFLSSTTDELVQIDLNNNAAGTAVGPFGFSNVFGLATASDGILYGVSDTNLFSTNTSTGEGTLVLNFSGQGLNASFGSSFSTEAGGAPLPGPMPGPSPMPGPAPAPAPIPEPSTMLLLGTGMAGLIVWRWMKGKPE